MPDDADNEFLFSGRWRRRFELFEDFDFTSKKTNERTDSNDYIKRK